MLYAFISFKGQFTDRMITLLDGAANLAVLRLHLERLAEIGQQQPETEPVPAVPPRRGPAELELVDLGFGYGARRPPLLEGSSARLPAGSLTLVTGPSGCGKTTLLRLMSGLLVPDRGELRIDGRPLADHGLDAWRRRTAVVLQNDRLLTGTLAENLAFFDPSPDMGWLEECARATGLDALVAGLPLGWQTRIGEGGTGLSGGQRQRLLLARALYARPDALFVDEGTAHLDADSARRLGDLIAGLSMTRVVVSHAPEHLPPADLHLGFDGPEGTLVRYGS
jgi:ATP-binding cassette subfamily B protein RaxB